MMRFISILVFTIALIPWRVVADVSAQLFAKKAPESIADLEKLEKQVQKVIEKCQASTVKVAGGSGVVIDASGTVLTVAHLARTAGRTLTVTFPDGRQVKGKTLGSNHDEDAALVQIIDEGDWPYVEMGDSEKLVIGQWCVSMGYPVSFEAGKAPNVRVGRVLHNYESTIMTDCVIMGGDSGGPIFDLDGKVIGISSRCDKLLIRNFHVPIGIFTRDWKRLMDKEVWNARGPGGPFLGVGPTQGTHRPLLGFVTPGSAADSAGMEEGDLILSFAGKDVGTYNQLTSFIRRQKAGDEVVIRWLRGNKGYEETVKIGKREKP